MSQRGTAVELSDTHLDREPSARADQVGRRAQYANERYEERSTDIALDDVGNRLTVQLALICKSWGAHPSEGWPR